MYLKIENIAALTQPPPPPPIETIILFLIPCFLGMIYVLDPLDQQQQERMRNANATTVSSFNIK